MYRYDLRPASEPIFVGLDWLRIIPHKEEKGLEMSEDRTIEQMGRELDNLSKQVEVLRQELTEAFKLLYQHSHPGMVGRASFPGEDGSNESEVRREYAERYGGPLSRIAVLIDEDEDRNE